MFDVAVCKVRPIDGGEHDAGRDAEQAADLGGVELLCLEELQVGGFEVEGHVFEAFADHLDVGRVADGLPCLFRLLRGLGGDVLA